MDYPGDFPPTPEQLAELRLAANADWLTRARERRLQEGDPQFTLRDGRVKRGSQLDAEMMERDNQKALAAARKAIEGERKVHKCYVCGRRDLPRIARWFLLCAVGLWLVWLYLADTSRSIPILGYLAAAAAGAFVGSALHENEESDDEKDLRVKFNETSHD